MSKHHNFGTKPLSPPAASKLIGVSTQRIRGLIEAGRLKATNVGIGEQKPRWRIMPQHLEEFFGLANATPESQPETATATPPRRKSKRSRIDEGCVKVF